MTPMHVIVLGVLVVSLACGLEVRDLNGTHIMHVDSVNYVLANNSFSFTAPVLIVTDPGTFHIGADAEGKLLLMDIDEGAASNAVRWAQACESVACAGIVYYNLNDYITSVEHTWVFRTGPTIPFTKVPILLIHPKSGLTAVPYLLARHVPFAMTVQSGDYNEGSRFTATICYVFYVPCFVLSLFNALLVLYQLSRFLVSEKGKIRRIPKVPLLVMSTEFVATVMRCIWIGNCLFAKSQGIEFSVWRYVVLACVSWAFMGTAIVAFGLHDMLFANYPGGMPRKHRVGRNILGALLLVLFLFEEMANILPAFFYVSVFVNVTYFAILYFLFYLPICFCFIKYGRKISNELLKMKGSLSKVEVKKREGFARRVVQSGILGFVVDFVTLIIVFTNSINITVSIVGFTINLTFIALSGTVHVLSFVPGPSKMDVMTKSLIGTSVLRTPPEGTKSRDTKNLSTSKSQPAVTAQGMVPAVPGTQK
ncbi:Uncharacterized protein PBTT_07857 [Plasmodiophora brassicae]|nr:hypothetical protein PBRA_006867 [Plasmodiophora brassicae]